MSSLDSIHIRTVLQRCSSADVYIQGKTRGHLKAGLVALVGFSSEGQESAVELLEQLQQAEQKAKSQLFVGVFEKWWAKVSQLRLFSDETGKMNQSLMQMPEEFGIYLVSQFTLFADIKRGNRPGFSSALSAGLAELCFEQLVEYVSQRSSGRPVLSGIFAADMKVSFVNEGPVTLMFDFSPSTGFVSL